MLYIKYTYMYNVYTILSCYKSVPFDGLVIVFGALLKKILKILIKVLI